jgi:hypothetical protein
MTLDEKETFVGQNYEHHEYRHALSILQHDFNEEWVEIIDVLSRFRLYRNYITTKGANKSHVSKWIDGELLKYGWVEKKFDTRIVLDGVVNPSPTHSVDCFKNRIALEIEWNNKDPFYDRDLNNFRLLHQLDAVSVGVIVTRCSHLQLIFDRLERGDSYGNSTTHMAKLLPKINGGGGGGCPILVFGIRDTLYVDDDTVLPAALPKKRKSRAAVPPVVALPAVPEEETDEED